MRKISLNFTRKPTRSQILTSYRLSAEKIPVDLLYVHQANAGSSDGSTTTQEQQPPRRLFSRSRKITQSVVTYVGGAVNR